MGAGLVGRTSEVHLVAASVEPNHQAPGSRPVSGTPLILYHVLDPERTSALAIYAMLVFSVLNDGDSVDVSRIFLTR